ncbi:nuclear transport factor 2 family protein [Burkholderia sp. MR1-5-21]
MSATRDDLETRVARLEAIDAIRELKARYTGWADAKYTPDYWRVDAGTMCETAWQQALCFTEDAVWHGGQGFGDDLAGRAALHAWFQRSPWRYALHVYGGESIEIDGDAARGCWRLTQIALRDDDGTAVLLVGVTDEAYRRDADGQWRISAMRFAKLQMMSLGETPLALAATFAGLDAKRSWPTNQENR